MNRMTVRFRSAIVLLAIIIFLPMEAQVSGTVRIESMVDMVYVQLQQGLKHLRGSPDQIESARKANDSRIRLAHETADQLALVSRDALLSWQKTLPVPIEFKNITEKPYNFFDKSHANDVRLFEKPIVIVRFSSSPDSDTVKSASTAVQKALSSINAPK